MKIFLLVVLLVFSLSCFNQQNIQDIKYIEADNSLILALTTVQPAKCIITWCTSDGCVSSEKEPEFNTLHLTAVPFNETILYYTIIVENSDSTTITKKFVYNNAD